MEKHLSHTDAFLDFLAWFKGSEGWKKLTRKEQRYIYTTYYALRDGRLGYVRVKNLLTKHAPERYEFRTVVIIKA